ncbi:hypothetical protein TWF730_006663 [Orbilia blumenaviensis]|uniref:Uncharacterized protein n=1 Tax=Orbilia blumenaviensis TaxID=1796055 RepID=A0AAV9VEX4_9PEZI
MHFSTLINAAVVVLTFADVTSAHCVFVDAYGNKDPVLRGFGLGFSASHVRKGFAQWPQQADIAVFNLRPVHTGWWKGYQAQGCGTSILSVSQWYQKNQPAKWSGKGVTAAKRAWYWKQNTPAGGFINIKGHLDWLVNHENKKLTRNDIATGRKHLRNGFPKVTAGGTLNVLVWQVNLDGGGPFKCRLENGLTGQKFGGWLPVLKNCHGDKNSLNLKGVQKTCWFTVQLPAHLNCGGVHAGYKDLCMMRCENSAKNGPFGGCIPFQQVKPKPIYITIRPPPQTVIVTKGEPLTVTKGDIITIAKPSVVTVTRTAVVNATKGQVLTIIFNGVTRYRTFTKKEVATITNATPATVTKQATVTVTDKSVVTIEEDATVTVTKAPVTTTSQAAGGKDAEPVPSASADPENDDANKTTAEPEATKTPTKEEIEAAAGGEEISPEDLKEVEDEKIDDKTKEDLKEEAEAGGKPAEAPETVEELEYF